MATQRGGSGPHAQSGCRNYGNACDVPLSAAGQALYAAASPRLKALFDRIHDGVIERVRCEVRSTRQDNTLNLKTGSKTSVALTVEPEHHCVRIDVMVASTRGVPWDAAARELAPYRSMLIDTSQPDKGPGGHSPWYWHYRASECAEVSSAVALIVAALEHWEKV